MGSMIIIVMKPGAVGCGPGFFAVISPHVRPFLRQRRVEPFDFPIGLRSIRSGAPVLHARPQRLGEHLGTVAGTVIGHHRGDGNAGRVEESTGSLPEPGCGFLLLVIEDLGIGQPRMVIDRVMQEKIAP